MSGRQCTLCAHAERHPINVAIVQGESNRSVARSYGFSEAAVRRHRREHIPKLLVESKQAVDVADADTLLDRLQSWTTRIEKAIGEVEEREDYTQFFRGVAVLRGYLEVIGEVTKELERHPQVNILIAPHVQQAIIDALQPYPEARQSVADALDSLEASS